MANTYNIFVSHSWQHTDDLKALQSLLNSRGYINVVYTEATKDEPINSSNAYYIKQRLASRISNSHIVLALAGIYASHSDWMEWELDKAIELKIPIVGVIPRGQERISQTVVTRSIANVKWNTESIVNAIRQYAKST